MATSVFSWSTTAGTNASADSNINWAEGQLPSTVNDSARAMMAALAAWRLDSGGYVTTGGTSTAYTLTSTQTISSRSAGFVGFTAHATNGTPVTLNVDGTGASPLRAKTGVALPAGYIVAGGHYVVTWDSSSSEWLLINHNGVALETGGALGTPSSGTLTNCTGLPVSTGVSGLGTGVATFLATPSSANLASAVTDETGTGALVFANSPTLVTPALGTPASGVLTNCTGLTTTGIVDANVTQAKLANPATFATSVATTSGTTIDFTSIPSWVRRITVVLSGVSTNGTGSVCVRVGSGSFATSGYLYSSTSIIGAVNTTQSSALFFSWFNASETSAAVRHGAFRLYNPTGNQWVCDHTIALSNTGAVSVGAGNITLGGTLDRVQLLNSAGDTFDAGAVNIVYEV